MGPRYLVIDTDIVGEQFGLERSRNTLTIAHQILWHLYTIKRRDLPVVITRASIGGPIVHCVFNQSKAVTR